MVGACLTRSPGAGVVMTAGLFDLFLFTCCVRARVPLIRKAKGALVAPARSCSREPGEGTCSPPPMLSMQHVSAKMLHHQQHHMHSITLRRASGRTPAGCGQGPAGFTGSHRRTVGAFRLEGRDRGRGRREGGKARSTPLATRHAQRAAWAMRLQRSVTHVSRSRGTSR